VLATILFSDIVDSTRTLERLSNHPWTSILREHNESIRAALDRFRGREIASTGDGFLALFDGAAKAVRAGALMDPAVADLGIRVPPAIWTGQRFARDISAWRKNEGRQLSIRKELNVGRTHKP